MTDKKQEYDVSDRPLFDPDEWEKDEVLKTANCYAYAVDDPYGHYRKPSPFQPGKVMPRPGEAVDKEISGLSVKCISKLAEDDGMIKAPDDAAEKPGFYLVALAIRPGKDFHWYRKDMDGTWSHKPGITSARNTDESGKSITDPKTADRGDYTDFGGYFYVPRGGMEIGSKVSFERHYEDMMDKDKKGELDKTRKGFLENLYKPRHKVLMGERAKNDAYHKRQDEKKAAILQSAKEKQTKIDKIQKHKKSMKKQSVQPVVSAALFKGGRT